MIKKVEIFFRKNFTKGFLYFLRAKKAGTIPPITKESKVILIRLNRIGDALVSTPLLKILKAGTGCHITLLAAESNRFVFNNNRDCDEILIYRKGVAGLFNTLKQINAGGYDVIIDLHDDVSTTVTLLTALSKVKFKWGLEKGNEKIFTHTVEKLDSARHHIIDRLMKFTELMGVEYKKEDVNVVYNCAGDSLKKVDGILNEIFSMQKPLVGVNISAGSEARFWGVERYKKLCDSMISRDINLVLITAEKDLHYAEEIAGGEINIFCSPSFDEFAAVISKLDFLFTPDTAAIHLASAYKIPVFGIYARYKTNDIIWSPYKSEFEYSLVEAPDFKNLEYEEVAEKFLPFVERFI